MILYFSGTGNSRYVAHKLSEQTQDTCVSLNKRMKEGNHQPLHSASTPFVFVFPTYAWRIPRVVDAYLRRLTFQGKKQAYFIMTCGADTSNALKYIRATCSQIGLTFAGFDEISMPDNYIALFPPMAQDVIDQKMRHADSKIKSLATLIMNQSPFPTFTPTSKSKSGIVNRLFYTVFVSAKGFYSTDSCIGCNACAELCALNNIKLVDKRPQWGTQCTHCMACINACPKGSIEYKKNTQGKARYYLP